MQRILLVMMALLCFGGVVAAQDLNVYCGELSTDDCALWTQSQEAMLTINSAKVDLSMAMQLSDPTGELQPLNVEFVGSGVFAGNFSELQQSQDELIALFSQPNGYTDYIKQALTAISADFEFTMIMPGEAMGSTEDVTMSLPLRYVDGVLYFDVSSVMGGASTWSGIDLAAALDQVFADQDLEIDLDSLNSPEVNTVDNPYVALRRVADSVAADGTPIAMFEAGVDMQGFVNDPAFSEQLDPAQQAQVTQMMGASDFVYVIGVGLEDHYIRHMHMDFDLVLPAEMMGGESLTVAYQFNLEMSNFNDVVVITAPENVEMIPLDGMIPSATGASAQPTTTDELGGVSVDYDALFGDMEGVDMEALNAELDALNAQLDAQMADLDAQLEELNAILTQTAP